VLKIYFFNFCNYKNMGNIISNQYVEYAFNLGQILIFGFMMGVCFWLYSLFSTDEIKSYIEAGKDNPDKQNHAKDLESVFFLLSLLTILSTFGFMMGAVGGFFQIDMFTSNRLPLHAFWITYVSALLFIAITMLGNGAVKDVIANKNGSVKGVLFGMIGSCAFILLSQLVWIVAVIFKDLNDPERLTKRADNMKKRREARENLEKQRTEDRVFKRNLKLQKDKERDAVSLQAVKRKEAQRLAEEDVKKKERSKFKAKQRNTAAIKLQSVVRKSARKKAKQRNEAATTLQSVARKINARREAAKRRRYIPRSGDDKNPRRRTLEELAMTNSKR
jgi:hypothetical protein